MAEEKDSESAPSFKRFVTFYITNFPPHATFLFLRKGFEVCGILEDVFVANNRHCNGVVYGFVKVRDVDKQLKALNNVCFGQYCVHAKLARFDKSKRVREFEGDGGKVRLSEGDGGKAIGRAMKVRGSGPEGEKSVVGVEGVGEGAKVKGLERKESVAKEVRVRSVLVRVGESLKIGREGVVGQEGVAVERGNVQTSASMDNVAATQKLVRKYRPREEDVTWARQGLIGTVINGEPIPIVQRRIEDVGFRDLEVIPIGADKVFLRSLSGGPVSDVVREAKLFFDLLFTQLVPWEKAVFPFRRGAWLRVYGIPLHGWNENFLSYVFFIVGVIYAQTISH